MSAFVEKAGKPRFCFRDGVGAGDPNDVEAIGARACEEGGLELDGLVQKSRSA